jgi:ribosome biogenesis GTPase
MAKDNNKQKHRISFRKNRGNRTRHVDFTRDVDLASVDDEKTARVVDLPQTERLSGKGSLTRNRTVIAETDEDGSLVLDVDVASCLRGRVLSPIGLNSLVQAEDGRRFECTVRRLVRTMARDGRNAIVAGDWVLFQPQAEGHGAIQRVEPRKTTLARGSKRHEHVIVANVDQIVIVVSASEPPLKPSLVDRFMISAAKGGAGILVCINKADLVNPAELQMLVGIYGRIGCQVVLISAATGAGMDRLRTLLRDRQSVFTGQSGVGKSSLLNVIQPGLARPTAEVSSWTQKGRHTTRTAVLVPLASGGWVVDTPGIRQMELWDVLPEEVEGYFVEFRPFISYCQFPDCSHTHEKICRVKQAVRKGLISAARYESYLKILSGQDEEE